jgi:hypothetical protein
MKSLDVNWLLGQCIADYGQDISRRNLEPVDIGAMTLSGSLENPLCIGLDVTATLLKTNAAPCQIAQGSINIIIS